MAQGTAGSVCESVLMRPKLDTIQTFQSYALVSNACTVEDVLITKCQV